MRSPIVVAFIAVLLSSGASAALSLPAAADTPGCVTRAEYRAARHGNAMTRVHGMFDTQGRQSAIAWSGGYGAQVRTYRGCGSPYSVVSVSYDRSPGDTWRLAAKAAVWVG